MSIDILPAIDLRGGNAVRLYQGDYDQETVYGSDPAAIAKQFAHEGAKWIHVVDLDGARDGAGKNGQIVQAIVATAGVRVQLGGGIRSDADIERVLAWGVSRVVVGTAAAENPSWFAQAVQRFAGKLVAAIDVKNGKVATRGWITDSGFELETFVARINEINPAALVFTEISRDGAMQGPDLLALKKVLSLSKVPVIASGGISSLSDLRAVKSLAKVGPLCGIITGTAIYEKAFTVTEAINAVR